MNFLLLILFLVISYIFFYQSEQFSFESGMLVIKRLDGSLINKFKIDSNINLSGFDVSKLFKKDDVVRMYIPRYHSANIIYKTSTGGYSRTIELTEGAHDIKRIIDEDIIDQIEAKYNPSPRGDKILVVDRIGNTLFETDSDLNINWNIIYSDYGLDDYYIVYPWGRRLYNYPYYKYHRRHYRRPGTPLRKYRRR